MFTGLVKDIGTIISVEENTEGKIFEIKTNLISEIKIDDSVAVNGCCLTATKINENSFIAQAVHVTLEKTSLGYLQVGSKANLELAMRLSDRLGGHLVQGHVNAKAKLKSIEPKGNNINLWFDIPVTQMKYIISEGSIAISGISLTVAAIVENSVMVTIIPHTWHHTNLNTLNINDEVNIEVDMMAKYLENFSKYEEKRV